MSESLRSKSCDLQRKGHRTMHRHIKPAPTPNQWGGIPNTWGTTPQSTPTPLSTMLEHAGQPVAPPPAQGPDTPMENLEGNQPPPCNARGESVRVQAQALTTHVHNVCRYKSC